MKTNTFIEQTVQPENKTENKHYIYWELQQAEQEIECHSIFINDIETDGKPSKCVIGEKDTKECDFREMTRMDESKRGKVKRLQAGTRELKRKEELKKKTGTVLAKIAQRIQDSIQPDGSMPEVAKLTKHEWVR